MSDVDDAMLEAAERGFLPPNTNANVGNPGSDSSTDEPEGEQIPWESPIPFESIDVAAFPTDALPPVQRRFVEASALALQVPTDLQGSSG